MVKKQNLQKKLDKPSIKSKVRKPPSRAKLLGAITLLALGLLIMPSGFVLADIIQDEIDKGIAEQISLPTDDKGDKYDEWVSNDYDDAPEVIRTFYIWNLTNPEGVLAGDKPNYEEVGPFVFREFIEKYAIEFSDDEEEVTFKEYSNFQQISGDNLTEVMITNINPAFLGAIELGGGTERGFLQLLLPIVLTTLMEEFEAIYTESIENTLSNHTWIEETIREMVKDCVNLIPLLVSGTVGDIMMDSLTTDILEEFLRDAMPTWEDVFYEEWANDYFPEINANFSILIDNVEYRPFNLLEDQIEQTNRDILSDPDVQDIMNEAIRKTGADIVDESGSESGVGIDIEYNLLNKTILPESDLNISTTIVIEGPRFVRTYQALSLIDAVVMDLATYIVTGGTGLTIEQCVDLWNKSNPYSLTGVDVEINKIWNDAMNGDTESRQLLNDTFNLIDPQLDYILDWIDASLTSWIPNAAQYQLDEWNSGLIVRRSAEEWLFEANDTAVNIHSQYYQRDFDRSVIRTFENPQNTAEAEEFNTPSMTVKTGEGDIEDVGQIIEYNGQETINIWAEPIKVEGTNGMQYGPDVSSEDTLKVFSKDLMRVVELEYDEPAEIYNIDLLRFEFSEDTFKANPTYLMETSLINLAPVEKYRNVPVRVSKPHFLGAEVSIQTGVNGMKPNSDIHDTYIDIEPLTGLTMNARQCAQLNFELSNYPLMYTNISNIVMPILWYEQTGEVTEELADMFKDELYSAIELKENVPMVFLGIGAALCIPGAYLTTIQTIKRRRFKKEGLTKVKSESVLQKKGIAKKDKILGGTDASKLENREVPMLDSNKPIGLKTDEIPKPRSDNE
ncbi:MAG: hypothetical protein ACFFAH_02440 [Promethearchaeota archaeon]